MTLILFQIIAATAIWLISILAGLSAIKISLRSVSSDRLLILGEAFAGGIFLGAAFFHMLPEAQDNLHQVFHYQYPVANLICIIGFCLLLFLERMVFYLKQQQQHVAANVVPLLLTVLFSIHALSEGIALGINANFSNALILFIAIMVHKGSEGFAVASQLTKGTLSLKNVVWIFLFFTLMSPLGVTLGTVTSHLEHDRTGLLLSGIFNAFAAGTFLYIATFHKLHHQQGNEDKGMLPLQELTAFLLGLGSMAAVAIWV